MLGSTSFLSSDGIRSRCAICITGSALSFVSSLVAVHLFFSAPLTIRSSPLNYVVIGAIMLQGLQGLQRTLTSCLMLSNSLSAELCNIVGVANTFIDVSTAILIIGFYYKLMALRLPLFSFVTRRMNSVLAHLAERYFFIVFSVLWGSLVAVWGILSATQEPTGALFASQLGWCQLKFREDGHLTSVFSWGVAFPAIMQLSLAVASFVSLRCFVGSSMEHVTIGKYWPVYVRWCAIIVFNSVAYAVAAIGLANDEKQWGLMLEMFIWPFAGVAYAASFIFTEQLVKYFRHDETDNGFSSSISALLATEVSGLHADLVGASGLEESDILFSRNSSKPRGSMPGVQVRSSGFRQSHS